jgi:predicted RNA binding protein YcfA (HicA-like mRNA interferase family)
MKRDDIIRTLHQLGCELVRHGGKHDWSANHKTGQLQAVPRHREIHEHLAQSIIKALSE